MFGLLRKLFITVLTLVIMLVMAVVIIPFFVPAEEFKAQILSFAKEKLGREITVEGPVEFVLFPDISLKLSNVKVANAKGYTAPYFAQLDAIHLNLALMPLLSREIVVQELALENPTINLEKGIGDDANWNFAPKKSGSQVEDPLNKASASEEKSGAAMQYDIGSVTLSGGTVSYRSPEQEAKLENINFSYDTDLLELVSDVTFKGISLRPELNIQQPANLLEGKASPLRFELQNAPASVEFSGTLSGVNINAASYDWQLQGALEIATASLAAVQEKFTQSEASELLQKPFSLSSREMRLNGKTLEFLALQTALGETEASGRLNVAYGGSKPKVGGELNIASLDLDKLLGEKITQTSGEADTAKSKGSADKKLEWSKEPIDLSGLKAVDAEVALNIASYRFKGMEVADMNSQIGLKNGRLTFKVPSATLDSGTISVDAVVDASQKLPSWSKQVNLTNVPFQSLTKAFMDKTRLTGTTNGRIGFSGQGNSVHDWVSSLAGGGNVSITEGVIEGYSLTKLFRNLKGALDPSTEESTPFSRMHTEFAADSGVMNFSKFRLEAPLLQSDAKGEMSLKDQTMDIYVTPKIVPKLEAAAEQQGGLMVPLRVHGPWQDISITPDIQGAIREVLNNPQALKDAAGVIREEGRTIRENFQENKGTLKDSFQQLKTNKDPKSLNDVLNALQGLGKAKPAENTQPEAPQSQ